MFLSAETFFVSNSLGLQNIRHNTLALVHYGFSREEVLWMPMSEVFDYIQLINKQIEEETEQRRSIESKNSKRENETPTLSDVYRGPIG